MNLALHHKCQLRKLILLNISLVPPLKLFEINGVQLKIVKVVQIHNNFIVRITHQEEDFDDFSDCKSNSNLQYCKI
jgi:hypothetical protein